MTENRADRRRDYPVLHLARAILEADTPLSISTGTPDGVFDTALVTDANDLPAIPGSSLAGVLRQLWRESYPGATSDDALFGFQQRASGDASRVIVSWGTMLDSQGRAAEGLLAVTDPSRLEDDSLLQRARSGIDEPRFRNRVRISHRGTAADTGKFDRALIPRGYRFAIELRLWSRSIDDPDWTRLLDLLDHPAFRLGGATRAGLGKMRCIRCHQASFRLDAAGGTKGAAALAALDPELHAVTGLSQHTPDWKGNGIVTGMLTLAPRGFWRIGQGTEDLRHYQGQPNIREADLLPVIEETVHWPHNGPAQIHSHHLLFPASSLKGALAHRMSFHAHRIARTWAQPYQGEPSRPAWVDALLGSVKDKTTSAPGQAGAMYLDDVHIPLANVDLREVPHIAIDRFTGGVRNGVFFEELSVYKTHQPIVIPIALDESRLKRNTADTTSVSRALKAALDDLCQARLPLGSRTATGNGFFDGELTGPLKSWLDSPPKTPRHPDERPE